MEYTKAWTRQNPAVLDELINTGVYRVKEEYIREKNGPISEYYLELYDWYSRLASRIVPLSPDAHYPIWLFLDDNTKLPLIDNTVVLEFEIPSSEVVITDVDRWGYRVNYMYVPLDDEDQFRHDDELKKNGIGNETALIQTSKGNFYPLLKRKIIESWSRVFEEPKGGFKTAQGTVWELRHEWLKGVEQ